MDTAGYNRGTDAQRRLLARLHSARPPRVVDPLPRYTPDPRGSPLGRLFATNCRNEPFRLQSPRAIHLAQSPLLVTNLRRGWADRQLTLFYQLLPEAVPF